MLAARVAELETQNKMIVDNNELLKKTIINVTESLNKMQKELGKLNKELYATNLLQKQILSERYSEEKIIKMYEEAIKKAEEAAEVSNLNNIFKHS